MSAQGWAAGLVLVLLGYAWHDALRGRLPAAGRWALLGLLLGGAALALGNVLFEPLVLPLAAAPALGWSLRALRAPSAPPLPAWAGPLAGLAYAGAAVGTAAAWSGAFVAWAFVAGAVLVVLRAVADPLLARRRGGGARDAPDAESATVK